MSKSISNKKKNALLEIVKRGGTLNERKIACEKLLLITGKNYSHLLPKENKSEPKTVNNEIISAFCIMDLIKEISLNFPIHYKRDIEAWVGSKGLVITEEQLCSMSNSDYQLLQMATKIYTVA